MTDDLSPDASTVDPRIRVNQLQKKFKIDSSKRRAEQISDAQSKIEGLTAQLKKILDALNKNTDRLKASTEKIQALKEKYEEVVSSLKRAKFTRNVSKAESLQRESAELQEQAQILKKKIKQNQRDVASYKEKAERVNNQIKELKELIVRLKKTSSSFSATQG